MRKRRITELQRLTIEEFRERKKLPLVVVLDDIRSLHNVGSVFRTADAFCVERLALCGITAQPPSVEIHKTALGAEDAVAWTYSPSAVEVVEALQADGYTALAVEQVEGSRMLNRFEVSLGARYALVLGNEVKGVQQRVVDVCDGCLEIPQYGTKHSLNVSVAAGIALWEFFRQLGLSG